MSGRHTPVPGACLNTVWCSGAPETRMWGATDPLGDSSHKQHFSDPKQFLGLRGSRIKLLDHGESKLHTPPSFTHFKNPGVVHI